ncbi:hypothetical protein EAI_11984, partial [Harpegnathos saltator]
FNPNICHICKVTVAYNFITCNHCQMIIYCSQEHKQLHQPHHIQICKVIEESLLKMDVTWTTELNNMEWFHSRMELISLTEKELSRPLEFHEKQIILYAKSCRICHQQTNLRKCTTCSSANYCTDHAEIFQKIHNSNCD